MLLGYCCVIVVGIDMKFKQCLKSSDMVVLVQPITDDELVIFDRKARGEIWKLSSDGFFIKQESRLSVYEEVCLHRAYNYIDENNVRLLLTYSDRSEKLYVHKIQETLNFAKTINIGSKFCLIQHDNHIYMATKQEANKIYRVRIVWGERYDITFEKIEVPDFEFKNQYLVKSVSDYTWNKTHVLSNSNFDLSSVPDNDDRVISKCYIKSGSEPPKGKEIIGTSSGYDYYNDISSIFCYTVINDMLICGHDGFVSVWSNNDNSTSSK